MTQRSAIESDLSVEESRRQKLNERGGALAELAMNIGGSAKSLGYRGALSANS
jgi:hypothetical protein